MCNLLGLQLAVPETSPGRGTGDPWEGARMSPACPWGVLTVAIPRHLLAIEHSPASGTWLLWTLGPGRGGAAECCPPRELSFASWVWVLNVFPKPDHVTRVCLFILFMAFMYLCVYLFIYLYRLVPEKGLRQRCFSLMFCFQLGSVLGNSKREGQ